MITVTLGFRYNGATFDNTELTQLTHTTNFRLRQHGSKQGASIPPLGVSDNDYEVNLTPQTVADLEEMVDIVQDARDPAMALAEISLQAEYNDPYHAIADYLNRRFGKVVDLNLSAEPVGSTPKGG
ncbi:MAG TPA: hypothetical protein VLA04_03825 [Verrucomicrobiae bacterium]|nr:hypothetical protein [Verrucomicrobiae bacterium]